MDVWMTADNMMGYYEDPDFLAGYDHMFTAEAVTAVWQHPIFFSVMPMVVSIFVPRPAHPVFRVPYGAVSKYACGL